ncbi:helicase-associated domain-containing protein [Quadrisphaera sp. DSM 44207]|uniref:helicase-associated domain-containing protein n=1 Tax=Quadrisphaera sp. DSM 44207 TaxID=1881057 RepID=UPI0008906A92|nr:helicase-associated domain-containing protein [Quadrisphaera sp. DSM 44207]SDQ65201.1 IclR helix-turn-helix domain-containing protein [Quadrisphaera sp. DSM 44207]
MPARTSSPRSLAEDLRSRDDAALGALLRSRPDLATPVPADTASLAARASTRVSVQRALDRLPTPALQVLQALAALPEPVPLADLARACDAPLPAVRRVVEDLRVRALVWGGERALHVVRAVPDVLGPAPAGLGPPLRDALGTRSPARVAALAADLGLEPSGDPVADLDAVAALLGDPQRLERLLADAPPAARELLDRLAWGPPTGAVEHAERPVSTARASTPLEWLLARGLLAAAGPSSVVLPREVAVALRGGRVLAGLDDEPPPLATTSRRPDLVDGTAAGAAAEAVRLVEELLQGWSAAPPPVLRAGGLGVRELRRVADRLEVDAEQAAFVVELARFAGLAADDGEADAAWAPTPAFDDWRAQEVPQRWGLLASSWLRTSRVPALVGEKDARGVARTALADDLDRTSAPLVRRVVLDELAQLPPGAAADAEGLAARVRWRAPRRAGALAGRLVGWTLREAAWLGVTGAGALSTAGRHVVAEDADAAAAALAAVLPAPVEAVLLQADLTAVAPGPLVPALAAQMALVADVDSRGGATVYRFTPASVRRALDAGRGAADVLAFLAAHSSTPVPQPLEYLVADVARRHGRVRVGVAGSYLRSDDEAQLAEVVADRRAAPLRLRLLAPTVAAAQADPPAVLEALRAMGLAPAVEGADADLVLRRPREHRSPPRERPRPVTGEPPAALPTLVDAVVRALRAGDAGDEPAGAGRGGAGGRDGGSGRSARDGGGRGGPPVLAATEPAVALEALREAAASHRSLWVGLTDRTGRTSVRLVEPVTVEGGMVTALDAASGQVRTMSVHRVTGVAPA